MPDRQAAAAQPVTALNRFIAWTRDTALPFWADRGFDPAARLFEEALDFDGRPLELPHRAMVQARQIFVFANAYLLGWYEGGDVLAEQAAATLLERFCIDVGGRTAVVFATNRDGGVVAPVLDSYTHAFVLFALAWTYRLTGQRRFLSTADRILAFVNGELKDPLHGGLLDHAGASAAPKRQNPLMHLLEACLALDEAAPERGYLEHANGLVETFERKLLRRGIVVETSAPDWRDIGDAEQGNRWEPGHHYEWTWLLQRYAERSGADLSGHARQLCSKAAAHGHSETGLIYDELSEDANITGRHHRLWPHTEAIKAALCRHPGREATPAAFATVMADSLMKRFLGRPFPAGWIDRIDGFGKPTIDKVPSSSLYHLMLAATEAARTPPIHGDRAGDT